MIIVLIIDKLLIYSYFDDIFSYVWMKTIRLMHTFYYEQLVTITYNSFFKSHDPGRLVDYL